MSTFKKYSRYGRKWRIIVIPRSKFSGNEYNEDDAIVLSDSTYGDNALHCKFKVHFATQVPTYGDITVYNLSAGLSSRLAIEGARVIIEAGYKDGAYGKIWDGRLFHFIEYRENVVNRVSILHTIRGKILENCFVMANLPEKTKIGDRFEYITRQLKIDAEVSKSMNEKKDELVRPETVFELDPYSYLRDQTKNMGLTMMADENGMLTMPDLDSETSSQTAVEISPDTGLVGTPAQVPNGINFKTLLDPRLKWEKVCQQILLKNSEVINTPQMYGSALPLTDLEGRYKLIAVTHIGDTRGTEWHSLGEAWVNPDQRAQVNQPVGDKPVTINK
jgi:hypothetical protein